jgi:hypothetical protein
MMTKTIIKELMSANSIGASFIISALSQYLIFIDQEAHSMPKYILHEFIEIAQDFQASRM